MGRKIGLTSPAVQAQMGVSTPDFGVLLADMAFGDDEPIPATRLLQPRVEAEVAFVLGRDLPERPVIASDVMRATEFVVAAIEVVDSRIQLGLRSRHGADKACRACSCLALAVGSRGHDLREVPWTSLRRRTKRAPRACPGPCKRVVWLANPGGRECAPGREVMSVRRAARARATREYIRGRSPGWRGAGPSRLTTVRFEPLVQEAGAVAARPQPSPVGRSGDGPVRHAPMAKRRCGRGGQAAMPS